MKVKHRCQFPAPLRVWVRTGLDSQGRPTWASRDWRPATDKRESEKAVYERAVLGR